jgi:galactofuranose transport system permease protein
MSATRPVPMPARRPWPRWAPTVIAIAVLLAIGALRHPNFLSAQMLCDLAADQAVLGIAAIGATIVLVSGAIDLSVGSLAALASVAFAALIEHAHCDPRVAAPIVVLGGALCGIAMAALIEGLALPAFLVTLAGMFLFRGIALATSEESIAIQDPAFLAWTNRACELGGQRLRLSGVVLFAIAVIAAVATRRSRALRAAHAIGGDAEAARLSGISVRRTRFLVFAVAGACSASAGLVLALVSGAGNSIACSGLELDAIASAVIGGIALTGGRGTIGEALLGVALFGLVQALIVFEGDLDAGWTRVATGGLVLAFVALRRILERTRT